LQGTKRTYHVINICKVICNVFGVLQDDVKELG